MDIVKRLRASDNDTEWVDDLETLERKQQLTLAWEAAAEIETLRREIAGFREAFECEKTHGARRNFVLGAKWWQAHKNGATAFASECDEMDREALKRYGLPQSFSDGMTAEDDKEFNRRWDAKFVAG